MWDVETGTYSLIGFKEEGEEDESKPQSPLRAKATKATNRLKNKVSREGVEAF